MNILVAGDLHFNIEQFRWLEKHKESYDCLCLTGDFLDKHSDQLYQFQQQTDWVCKWMLELNKQIFVCSGNHDLDEFGECDWLNNIKSSTICSDNKTERFNGIRFGCIPYLGGNLSDFYGCDVLLTHVPPLKTATSRTMVSGMYRDFGDEELYHALKERFVTPCYIFCGHVEKPLATRDRISGVEIINPGAERGASVPNHEIIVI